MDGQGQSSAKSPATVTFSPAHFGDVDEFSEWAIAHGWDVESVQLSAGASPIRYDHFMLPEMMVSRLFSGPSMKNVFAVPKGAVVFVICREKLPVVWSGREIPATIMGIVRSGQSHWAVLPAGFDCYEFTVSEELIRRTELFPPNFLERTEAFERGYLPLAEPQTGNFVRGLDAFFRLTRDTGGSLAPAMYQTDLLEFILQGLLRVIDAGLAMQNIGGLRNIRRPDLVMKAREMLLENIADEWTAGRLAESLGVSYRALNYAFRDTLGISPYRYVLNEKLLAARRGLKSGHASVTEACFSHGFSTPSRFSQQYARLFGELPSATRSRSSGAIGWNGRR